jgi:quercetin dioxygenase-like cupin family protein
LSDDDPDGGDPACWSHLFPASDEPGDVVVDLAGLARAAASPGAIWTHQSDDLNVNLLVFPAGEGVAEHVNADVDVLLVGISGDGLVAIDGVPRVLRAGQTVLIPKGARRSTQAVSDAFAYLSCHRRRAGLWPTTPP